MTQSLSHVSPLTAAYQATAFWKTLIAPDDYQLGPESAAWEPVATELSRSVAVAGNTENRRACYGQILALVRQSRQQVDHPAALLDDGQRKRAREYLVQLETKYARLTSDAP